MKPQEKQEMNIVVIMGLIGAAFGAFSYFTSQEAHQRGEGFNPQLPGIMQPDYRCKPAYDGDTYCKFNK